MGLFVARVHFENEPPPNEEVLTELERRIGSSVGAVEAIDRDGSDLTVSTMLDPVAYPYLLKLLVERGGQVVHYRTREPVLTAFPPYVATPWIRLPWWKRVSIRFAFLVGLLRTIEPRAS